MEYIARIQESIKTRESKRAEMSKKRPHRTALDSAFADYQLTWDANNNITRILSDDGKADYTYDFRR